MDHIRRYACTGKVKAHREANDGRRVMREIRKDVICYYRSRGGLTISEGEVLIQAHFAKSLLQACKKEYPLPLRHQHLRNIR